MHTLEATETCGGGEGGGAGPDTETRAPAIDTSWAPPPAPSGEALAARSRLFSGFADDIALPHTAQMEAGFGGGLGHLRAHVDPVSCGALGAEAWALGDDLVFASGAPSPHTVAHEIAHTRQGAPGIHCKKAGPTTDPLEKQADDTASLIMGGAHSLEVSASALWFPDTVKGAPAGEQTVEITNKSDMDIPLGDIRVVGPCAGDFSALLTTPVTLFPAGSSVTIRVGFKPNEFGQRQATLSVGTAAGRNPVTVPLIGLASEERWNAAAKDFISTNESAAKKHPGEADPGYGDYHKHMHAAGYSYDEAQRAYLDVTHDDWDDWLPKDANLLPMTPEWKAVVATLYPGLSGHEAAQYLRHRYRGFRDILDQKVDYKAVAAKLEVPTGTRIVQALIDQAGFSPDECSVLYAMYKHDNQLVLLGDGSQLTIAEADRRHTMSRYEAGDALTNPGGTLGYAIAGIFTDDEDKRLAWAQMGANIANAGTAMAEPYASRPGSTSEPEYPQHPMEPDKPTIEQYDRGTEPEMEPPMPEIVAPAAAAGGQTAAPAAGGQVTGSVPGLYQGVDGGGPVDNLDIHDRRSVERDGTRVTATYIGDINGERPVPFFRRAYNPNTKTLEMREAFLEDAPGWTQAGAVPLVPGRGTPTATYLTLRQMKMMGVGYGELQKVKMSTIQNVRAVLEFNVQLVGGVEPDAAVMNTHSVQYGTTTITQAGSRIVSGEVKDGRRGPLQEMLEHYENRAGKPGSPEHDAKVREHDALIAQYGQGKITRQTEVWWDYNIYLSVAPIDGGNQQ